MKNCVVYVDCLKCGRGTMKRTYVDNKLISAVCLNCGKIEINSKGLSTRTKKDKIKIKFPTNSEVRDAVIETLEYFHGGPTHRKEIFKKSAEFAKLTKIQIECKHTTGTYQTKWENMVDWALSTLKKSGKVINFNGYWSRI